ncbi:hypothetical protein ACH5RR_015791 [Cinchona calisaya]|uniref:Uncharacterized protein n=1 Tax=Cinchona calisaya TaxID=153742 RepID=A0ABD2ZU54_9GENT
MALQVFKYVPKARRREDRRKATIEGFVKLVRDESLPQKRTIEGIGISIQENDGLSSRYFVFQRIQRDGLPSQEHCAIFSRLSSPKLQDDQLGSGLLPSVFHWLGESKDHESKPEGSSQKSVFERIGDRDIKTNGKGLKRLGKEVEDDNEICSTMPSRMMHKTRWEI